MQDPQEIQRDIQKQFRTQQEKYIYYVIALSVACIGFAVNKSIDQPLKWIQIPLGISVLSWGASIVFGFSHIQKSLSILAQNSHYFELEMQAHILNNSQVAERAKELWDEMIRKSREGIDYTRSQYGLFLFGIVAFIIWHILEMYLRTIM